MRRTTQAFTLIELIVVIAILSIVMAILFPVFQTARGGALRASCLGNLHQISAGTVLYASDYDDKFMPINYQPASAPNSRNDRTWVQMLLPYVQSFEVFQCPADYGVRPEPEAMFDQDLVPGDTDSQYYTASLRSDYGYNYQYLAPVEQTATGWTAMPKSISEVGQPSNTAMFMDSVWARTSTGTPYGGGNWLVVPPCRYFKPRGPGTPSVDTFTQSLAGVQVYTTVFGWQPENENASNEFGGAWPWHYGRLNVVFVDGSARSMDPSQLTQGCQLEGRWAGYITDPSQYVWELH